MKTLIAFLMMMALITASGCWSSTSNQGGIAPTDETFSISVPSSSTIKQGEDAAVVVTLNRGSAFKQDVQVEFKADGISVTPKDVLVKASDKPEAKVKIAVAKNAALGDYIVNVKATPATGKPASTAFTVKVVVP